MLVSKLLLVLKSFSFLSKSISGYGVHRIMAGATAI